MVTYKVTKKDKEADAETTTIASVEEEGYIARCVTNLAIVL